MRFPFPLHHPVQSRRRRVDAVEVQAERGGLDDLRGADLADLRLLFGGQVEIGYELRPKGEWPATPNATSLCSREVLWRVNDIFSLPPAAGRSFYAFCVSTEEYGILCLTLLLRPHACHDPEDETAIEGACQRLEFLPEELLAFLHLLAVRVHQLKQSLHRAVSFRVLWSCGFFLCVWHCTCRVRHCSGSVHGCDNRGYTRCILLGHSSCRCCRCRRRRSSSSSSSSRNSRNRYNRNSQHIINQRIIGRLDALQMLLLGV